MISPANGAGDAQGAGFGAVRARLVWRGNYRNGDKRSASSVTFDNVQAPLQGCRVVRGTSPRVPESPIQVRIARLRFVE